MRKIIGLTNKTFGRLTVIRRAPTKNRQTYWVCQCSCGEVTHVRGGHLTSGATRSCGCLCRETTSTRNRTHSMTGTPEYNSYRAMLTRCYNTGYHSYHRYGGRGIIVESHWVESPSIFFNDMGLKPSKKHSLERRDFNKNYCKENCFWANPFEQADNTCKLRRFKAISPDGDIFYSDNQSAFAREHSLESKGINGVLRDRAKTHKGWVFHYSPGVLSPIGAGDICQSES